VAVAAAAAGLAAQNARACWRSHYGWDWLALRGAIPREQYLASMPIGLGERVSRWLAPMLRDGDTLFAWGHMAEVYVYTRRWPPVRFVYVEPILEAEGEPRERLLSDLLAAIDCHPPTYFVIAELDMPEPLQRLVQSRYEGCAHVGAATIMRLKRGTW
jgi:hypothetical protein